MNACSDLTANIDLRVAEHGPEARVVTVVGQVDTPSALKLADSLITQLTVARVVVVNLDGVSFLGSAGLSTLFEANELATQQHRAVRLVSNSPIANRALASSGLRDYFIFADTVPCALQYPVRWQGGGTDVAVARRPYRSRNRHSLRHASRPAAPAI